MLDSCGRGYSQLLVDAFELVAKDLDAFGLLTAQRLELSLDLPQLLGFLEDPLLLLDQLCRHELFLCLDHLLSAVNAACGWQRHQRVRTPFVPISPGH